MPTERPILFKPELVRAILNGNKVETRRIMKPQPTITEDRGGGRYYVDFNDKEGWGNEVGKEACLHHELIEDICPYANKIGDILWVRETWCEKEYYNPTMDRNETKVYYKADWLDIEHIKVFEHKTLDDEGTEIKTKWKPSIHMPKKYCRLRLKITDIGVERLQDITVEDIIAEGVEPIPVEVHSKDDMIDAIRFSLNKPKILLSHKAAWIELWDRINAKRGFPWSSNPWLWVLKFEVEK